MSTSNGQRLSDPFRLARHTTYDILECSDNDDDDG